jgi:hypothetical protein
LTIWAIGRHDLNLCEDDFWNLTLKEFDALLKRRAFVIERQDFHTGLICAVLANIHRDPKTKAFTPQDFMPGKETKKQTPEDMLAVFKALNAKTIRKKSNG